MENKSDMQENSFPRIILGLDVSTSCIGMSVVKDNGDDKPEILYLGHKTPKISKKIKGIEALFLKKNIFEEEFLKFKEENMEITDVIIEEPLLMSNNANTVASLLRFNGMIAEVIYRILGKVPNFISSYDARMFSFPELVAIRKFNKKGEQYPIKHIKKDIKDGKLVLFGAYPFDIDKKTIMMNMVNDMFKNDGIKWVYDKDGELKKENFDACDSLVCVLAYININHHGIEKPIIANSEYNAETNTFKYQTKIWNKTYEKTLILE